MSVMVGMVLDIEQKIGLESMPDLLPPPKIIEADWYMIDHEINEAENTFKKYYENRGYEVFVLRCSGADFLLYKDGKCHLLEVKTTLRNITVMNAILQVIYAKHIIEERFNIVIETLIIGGINEKENVKSGCKKYLKHFNVIINSLHNDNKFTNYEKHDNDIEQKWVPECFEHYEKQSV